MPDPTRKPGRRLALRIPDDVPFSALRLGREPGGDVSFDRATIARICEASGISTDVFFRAPEDNVAGLIVTWYARHLAAGGDPDPIAEQIAAEVRAEDGIGGLS